RMIAAFRASGLCARPTTGQCHRHWPRRACARPANTPARRPVLCGHAVRAQEILSAMSPIISHDALSRPGDHDRMWPDQQQTRDLLDRAKTGDSAAVDDLLDRHREALRRAIALRLDPALARRVDAS